MDSSYSEFIEIIRDKSDILEMVSDYVNLSKRGGKYWGCCPFHQEKTASFAVTPEKGFFYCFGCQTGGDTISFVQKIESLTFKDALVFIASKYGIAVPQSNVSAFAKKKEEQNKSIYELNELAKDYFMACLQKTAFGQEVQAYLSKRGVNEKTIQDFSLGAALPGDDRLYRALLKKGVNEDLIFQTKLVQQRSPKSVQDFFRSRLIIPIKDARSNVVGFGGRTLDNTLPKYLNSAESPWFNKRKILYGLDVALTSIKKSGLALVTEGYMDTISLHAAGFSNAVASLGTAFSKEQAKLLARLAKEVIFCYDSDQAGLKAAYSAISLAREENLTVKAVIFSEAKDPDEFLLKHGKEKFGELLAAAQDGFSFQKGYLLKQKDFSTLAGKLEVVTNILPILAEFKSEIELASAISALASDLVIDEAVIFAEYNKFRTQENKSGINKVSFRIAPAQTKQLSILERAESQLIKAAFYDKVLFEQICQELTGLSFTKQTLAEIFSWLEKKHQEKLTNEELFSLLSEQAKGELTKLILEERPEADLAKLVGDCLRQVKKADLEKSYNEYRKLAIEAESLGDSGAAQQYLVKSKEIKDEIKNLF